MKRFMKLLGVVLALVLIFGAVGCALETPETGLGDRLVALENRMAGLEAAIANIPTADTSALSNELSALRDDLSSIMASLETMDQTIGSRLASLDRRIEALEEEGGNGNGNGNGNGDEEPEFETARWVPEIYVLSDDIYEYVLNGPAATFYMVEEDSTIKPSHVEEPGDYEIKLWLKNVWTTDIDFVVEFNFTPRHGAIVYVDEVRTDMYTERYPWTYWDVEVVERGDDKHTTRISCLSETVYLPLGEEVLIRLVFTLAYK